MMRMSDDNPNNHGRTDNVDMPTHLDLILPTLRVVTELGGSAHISEITEAIINTYPNGEELAEIRYPHKPKKSIFRHRIGWARSKAKRFGWLENPSRGMYLITVEGSNVLGLPESEASELICNLDSEYNREYRRQHNKTGSKQNIDSVGQIADVSQVPSGQSPMMKTPTPKVLVIEDDADESDDSNDQEYDWKDQLLARLHELSPEGFEKFVIYLLRRYGLQLQHVGGPGDEGIDAIGTAPLSPVLSSRVAVQVKRYAPQGKTIGRETVALFQRDAQMKGAERAILVTLGGFSKAARKAAISAAPTVDLINGDRLADLIRDDGDSGVRLQPMVDRDWFSKFD
jgi:restriction endonuclease